MDLVVQLKHSTDCFVSLPPKIVHSLLLLSEKNSKSLGTIGLEITWYDKLNKKENKAYVGWAGGSTDPRFSDSIEMSQEMAICLGGIQNEQRVKVKALNYIEPAQSVQVEPLTSDDWEIMEVHQEYLEEQLLNQVNILYSGQIVPIWIHHKTIIKLKVIETLPTSVVKLSSNSEIIVAPKPRQLPPTTKQQPPQQPILSAETLKPRFMIVKDYKQPENSTFINEVYISKQLLSKFQWSNGDIIEISTTDTISGKKQDEDDGEEDDEDIDITDDEDNDQQQQDEDDKHSKQEELQQKLQQQLDGHGKKENSPKKLKKTIYSRVFSKETLNGDEIFIHKNIRTIGNFYINTLVRLKYTSSYSLPICPIGSLLVKQVIWKQNILSSYISNNKTTSSSTTTPPPIIFSDQEIKKQLLEWSNHNLSNNKKYPLLNGSIVSINSNLDLSFSFNKSINKPSNNQHQNQPLQQPQQQQSNNNNSGDQLNELTGSYSNPYLSGIQQIGDMMSNLNNSNNNNNIDNIKSKNLYNKFQMNNGLFMLGLDSIISATTTTTTATTTNSLFKVGNFEKRRQLKDYSEIGSKLFERVGGMEKQIKETMNFLSLYLYQDLSVLRRELNTPGVNGVLITGTHGCGKSLLINSLAGYYSTNKRSNSYVVGMDCSELVDLKVETVRKHFNKLFHQAFKKSGNNGYNSGDGEDIRNNSTILILESLDTILAAPNDQDPGSKIKCQQLLSHLKQLLYKYQSVDNPVIIIASSISSQSLYQAIQIPEILGKTIELQAPTREERVEIFEKYLAYNGKSIKNKESINLMKFSGSLEGYLGSDIEQIIDRSIHLSSINEIENDQENNGHNDLIDFSIIEKSKEGYTPITLKGIKLHTSETVWSDIGGLDGVRAMLKETIEWPTRFPKLFNSSPLRLRSGILLYGPTGCGKTLLASAIAGECGLNFISVKGPELLNKYIGSSEQGVRDVFSRASSAKPCVLFFDEFDSIAPRRGHDNSGVTDRVVNQFLTQLDGVEGLSGVYVLAATSRPDLIDPALLRPGRLDKSLYCNIPEYSERLDILNCLKSKMNLDPSVSLESLAEKTTHFTGADLKALMYNAQLKSIHEWMNKIQLEKDLLKKKKEEGNGEDDKDDFIIFQPKKDTDTATNTNLTFEEKTNLKNQIDSIKSQYLINSDSNKKSTSLSNEKPPLITETHLEIAFKGSTPSISESERKKYEKIYNNFLKERGSVTGNKKEGVPKQTLA